MKKSTVGPLAIAALLVGGLIPAGPVLAADAAITGSVTLAGVPVAGTEVGWFDPTTGVGGESVTAADGSYVLAPTDGHRFVLYAGIDHATNGRWLPLGGDQFIGTFVGLNGPDYLYQSRTPFTASGIVPIELSLPGTIVGKAAGLKNRKVALKNLDGSTLTQAKASRTGRFEFTGLVPGRYKVTSSLQQHGFENFESTTIIVTAGATTRVSPNLSKTGTVSGIVTVAGKPVAGVFVSTDLGYENGTRTNAAGRYVVKNVPAGKSTVIFTGQGTPETDDYSFRRYQKTATVVVRSGKRSTLDVDAPRPTEFTASVIPTPGAKNFTIALVDKTGSQAVSHFVKVGSKKRPIAVSLAGIRAGSYTVVVTDDTKKKYAKTTVTLTYGKSSTIGTVKLSRRTVSVSGKVRDSAVDRVSFVNDFSYGLDATAATGSYRITGLIPGKGILAAGADRGQDAAAPYYIASKRYSLPLRKSTRKSIVSGGPNLGLFTGSFSVGGLKIGTNATLLGNGTTYPNGARVTLGDVSGFATSERAVSYTLGPQHGGWPREFIQGAPFWLELPGDSITVTTRRGTTVDIGTVALEVHR